MLLGATAQFGPTGSTRWPWSASRSSCDGGGPRSFDLPPTSATSDYCRSDSQLRGGRLPAGALVDGTAAGMIVAIERVGAGWGRGGIIGVTAALAAAEGSLLAGDVNVAPDGGGTGAVAVSGNGARGRSAVDAEGTDEAESPATGQEADRRPENAQHRGANNRGAIHPVRVPVAASRPAACLATARRRRGVSRSAR